MRCLALADELKRRGIESSFASRYLPTYLADEMQASGYAVLRLEGRGSSEADVLRRMAPRESRVRPVDIVVTDHYDLGAEWLDGVRELTSRRIVIDDLANRRLPCEVVVNPNPGVAPSNYERLVTGATRLLLGVRYILVRTSFRNHGSRDRTAADRVRAVLVSMGGSDPSHVTDAAVRAVRSALPSARIEVVLGALYDGDPVGGEGIRVHHAIGADEMARLIADADLAIGAGGTSAWERCTLGLPTVILRLASNQDSVARELANAGVAIDAGPSRDLDVGRLSRSIAQLAEDQPAREAMRVRARELVDGRGVERVAHHLEGVRVRAATRSDARRLWRWANDPETRSASLSPEPIAYADHLRWLNDRLSDRSCLLLIGWNGAGPLGQVRFDVRQDKAEVSIAVAPEQRGTVGGLLLDRAVRRFRRRWPRTRLTAQVKVDNEASRRLFEHAGFHVLDEREGVRRYHAPAPVDASLSRAGRLDR